MANKMTSRSFSYSIFKFVTDEMRGAAVPIGVALWGSEPGAVWVKIASSDEHIKGLNKLAYLHIEGVRKELLRWIRSGQAPYGSVTTVPHSDSWWKHVARLLVHQIRVSEPRPIDCVNPDEEVDSLYEAVVGPRHPTKERAERIDRAIRHCLGQLEKQLDRGTVDGYKGREVEVHRFKTGRDRLLVIDGVNLASVHAELETDALVSKLLRIRAGSEGGKGKTVRACIGYLASPHGLNGEAALVDWIREKAEAEIFDLIREGDRFLSTVDAELAAIVPQTRFEHA